MQSKIFQSVALSFACLAIIAVPGGNGASPDTNGAPTTIRIALVGDSTVADYLKPGDLHRGWGQLFPEFVDTNRVTVQNFAVNGRSTKTFKKEGRWEKVLAFKPDYVFIQFGHNDSHAKEKPEATDAKTDYTAYLRGYVESARAQGAIPILVTPMHRGSWAKDGHHLTQELLPYADAMRAVAKTENVPLIDLYALSEKAFEALTAGQLDTIFANTAADHTHFNETGARWLAGMVAEETSRVVPTLKPYLKHTRDPLLPTLFVVGDSTVHNGNGDGRNGLWGWGEPFVTLFDPAKIKVENRARGGRSSRTFITEGLWDAVLKDLKPGDFVLIQMGHNDGTPLESIDRPRGTFPSTGDETCTYESPTTHQIEIVHSYGWYMSKMVSEAKARGATVIVLSPVPRNRWTADGKMVRNLDNYTVLSREVAQSEGVAFVDLNAIIADQYDWFGKLMVDTLFPLDNTHTSDVGAAINAASVVAGLKGLKDCPLTRHLSTKGEAIPTCTLLAGAAGGK
jgi:lysophospholipase L1-like esterase